MTEWVKDLEAASYRVDLSGNTILLEYEGDGEPDAVRVVPLIQGLKANKSEVLAYLRRPPDADERPQTIRQARDWHDLEAKLDVAQRRFEAGEITTEAVEGIARQANEQARYLPEGACPQWHTES